MADFKSNSREDGHTGVPYSGDHDAEASKNTILTAYRRLDIWQMFTMVMESSLPPLPLEWCSLKNGTKCQEGLHIAKRQGPEKGISRIYPPPNPDGNTLSRTLFLLPRASRFVGMCSLLPIIRLVITSLAVSDDDVTYDEVS